jgi:hypothetical protein
VHKGSVGGFDWTQPNLLAHAELIQRPACQDVKAVLAPHLHLEFENASEANY